MLVTVLFGVLVFPFSEDAYPHVVWTMMFVLWHVFIYSEDITSDPYSWTLIDATFLSWFLNVFTINVRESRVRHFLLDGNPKWYEVEEHIATKVEANIQMLSTFKNKKSIWSMNPGANFDASMVGPLVILVALVNIEMGQVSSKSRRFVGRHSMSPFLPVHFNLTIETFPKRWWISWDKKL